MWVEAGLSSYSLRWSYQRCTSAVPFAIVCSIKDANTIRETRATGP